MSLPTQTNTDRPRSGHLRGAQDGYSLVELMVVVLIIGILIAIALPTFLGVRTRAQERAAQADLRTGLAASLTYFASIGSFTGFAVGCTPAVNSCTEAEATEASLDWRGGPGAPQQGDMLIQVASGTELLLITQSLTNEYFCIAQIPNSPATDRSHDTTFANIDTTLECTGGW